MKDKQVCTGALVSLIFMLFSFHFKAVMALVVLKVIEELSAEFLHLDTSFWTAVFQVRSVLSTRCCPFSIQGEKKQLEGRDMK